MKVRLTYVRALDIDEENDTLLELAEGTTVGEVYDRLDIPPDRQRFVRAVVNGEKQKAAYELEEGDNLHLFIHIRS